ncbi:MAG: recombinase family protein [Planctomycetota bacterium]|nr:recombinase family protein [Planctomycetota bacterium]
MTRYHLEPPLAPRSGNVLRVIVISRISTLNQDVRSLADQQAMLRQWVEDRYDGPVEWTFIEGQGSGECVDRKQVAEAEELVDSGQFDLVVMEDLSRHMRRVHAVLFCEACEDEGTRLIAINDGIDTFKEWRLHAFFAAMKHEQGNKDTSLRIKRTLRNRFVQGGVVQFTIYGYIKPAGAKNDDDLQKDAAAESIYKEWFARLDRGETFSEIADWLNALGVPTGPFCRSARWTCAMVGRITRNPILKGVRQRNRKEAKRYNKTGKHKSVNAKPEDLLERICTHLAFFEAAYYDRVLAKVISRNAKYRRNGKCGAEPRANIPKKRIRYPGQSIRCGVCGRLLVFGAHGQSDHLMCSGAREYRCWNGISLDGPLTTQSVADMVFADIESLEDFDAAFVDMANVEARKLDAVRDSRLQELETLIDQSGRAIQNVLKVIRNGGESPSVCEDLKQLEAELLQLRGEKAEIEQTPSQTVVIPTASEIRQLARESVRNLALESHEFAKSMRSLVTDFFVFPYRCCDGKDLVLRGTARLQLANLLPNRRLQDTLRAPLERVLNLDLFEAPQRVRCRAQVMALRREITEREAAQRLGITKTAAQHAAGLDRLMRRLGLSDPYVRLMEPPMDYPKMRRHLHPRYRFDPLPGFGTT